MDIKFNCPKCGLAMQASTDQSGLIAQCPACAQEFGVEPPPVMPVVQARVVSSPAPPPALGESQRLAQGTRPQRSQSSPLAQPHAPARAKIARVPDRGGSQNRLRVIGLTLVIGLPVALAIWLSQASDQPEGPTPEQIAAKESEKEKISMEIELIQQRTKAKEADERKKQAELMADGDRNRKIAEEEHQKITREREELLQHYAKFFDGDSTAAEAFVRVINISSMEVVDSIMAKGTSVTEEVFHREMLRSLAVNIETDPALSQWMKERNHDPKQFIPKLLGTRKISLPKTTFDFAKYKGTGTGFCISPDGWFLTNDHVVGNASTVELRLPDGKVIPATVVKTNVDDDLALLKADLKATSWLGISKSDSNIGLGRTVFTVGYPNPVEQGVQPKFTEGSISAESGVGDNEESYQISVPLQGGNSGGALVDYETGWVIGVVNARLGKADAQLVSYAIKGKLVSTFFDSVPEASKAPPKPLKPGDKQAVITRATESSVLVLVPL